jgi:hypothetical protein
MKNITMTLDERTAAWAQMHAARHNICLSRYLSKMLREQMRHSRACEKAMKRFLAQKPVKLRDPADRYLVREQANDRAGSRRR